MKLHIGGTVPHPEWQILNVTPGPHVDHVGDLRELKDFASGCASAVYLSHVLEHLPLADVAPALAELARLLEPGGLLYVSVPDLETLCRLYLHPQADAAMRLLVMRMMFGGQVDAHDFHCVGFDEALLRRLLVAAGFLDVRRVASFGFFADTSDFRPYGVAISLNVVARK